MGWIRGDGGWKENQKDSVAVGSVNESWWLILGYRRSEKYCKGISGRLPWTTWDQKGRFYKSMGNLTVIFVSN